MLFSDDLLKGNPAVPGGSMKSKPMRLCTLPHSRVGYFSCTGAAAATTLSEMELMQTCGASMAQRIACAARAFEQQATGRPPRSTTVVLSEDTLVVTLRGTLSPAETALAKTEEGATQFRELLVGMLGLGEGWHNNRHAFPSSARHGMRWWQLDLSYLVIRGLECVGLAQRVRVPANDTILTKKRRHRENQPT